CLHAGCDYANELPGGPDIGVDPNARFCPNGVHFGSTPIPDNANPLANLLTRAKENLNFDDMIFQYSIVQILYLTCWNLIRVIGAGRFADVAADVGSIAVSVVVGEENHIFSQGIRRRKEWKDKLPNVVLKDEEIVYSKANSKGRELEAGVANASNITMIKDVDPMLDNITVQGRCVSLWHSHRLNEAHNPYSLDMVLQDSQNSRIQIYIKKEWMFRFEPLFKEGQCYSISNFAIAENRGKLPLLPHKYKISFYKGTVVTRINPFDENLNGFILEPFNRLLDGTRHYHEHEAVVGFQNFIPPYLASTNVGLVILQGVHYAFDAGGIVNETGTKICNITKAVAAAVIQEAIEEDLVERYYEMNTPKLQRMNKLQRLNKKEILLHVKNNMWNDEVVEAQQTEKF
nr:replication protein A 70 kDa DNA-binding subunit B [Tanacetum cinerariifolium]